MIKIIFTIISYFLFFVKNKKSLKIKLFKGFSEIKNVDFYGGATASKETRTAIIEFIENYDRVTEKWEKIKTEKITK